MIIEMSDELHSSIWSSLSKEQKQEVLSAYEEAEVEKSLVDAQIVFDQI